MDPSLLFSEADLEAIREASREAEGRTSGEIVPVVVGQCDDYDGAAWKAAALGSMTAALTAGLAFGIGEFWSIPIELWIALPATGSAALAFLLARIWPGFRRSMVSAETLDLRVQRRARQAFLEEEVFKTRERTGILVFVALFERRVIVLGDEGINRVVDQDEWEGVVAKLVSAISAGKLASALAQAIRECGRLLAVHGVEIRLDDEDELADGVRLEKQ